VRTALLIAAALLAALLAAPFFVPVPPLTDTVDPTELADSDSRFVDVDGLRVHYKDAGTGPNDFVLLHGFGASVFTWREVFAPLSQLGYVVAYDRPAFGLTERPLQWTGTDPYGDAAQTQLAIDLTEALHVDRAVWIANSAGARVAVDVASRYPDRVVALVLVDPAIDAPAQWLRPLSRTPQMQHLGPRLVRSISTRGDDGIRKAWHDPSRITDEVFAGYHKPLRARDWDRALWAFAIAERDPTIVRRATALDVPTLVITGADDRIVPTQATIDLSKRIPGSSLVVLPDCGHVPQEECPRPFIDAVQAFLANDRVKAHSAPTT